MSATRSILVVRLSAIGDLVLVAPVVAQLHHEGYEVTLLCKDAYRSVALCLPGVSEVCSWEKDRAKIREQGSSFTAVLDLQGTSKSKRWTRGLEAKVLTYKKPYLRRVLLLTFGQRFALEPVVSRYFKAAQPLLKYKEEVPAELVLPKTTLILPEGPYIAVVIGGTYAGKRLNYDQWRSAIRELLKLGLPIALVGGPEEAGIGESLEQPLGSGVSNYCGTTTIIEGMVVVKEAALVISGDTGFMHAAANFKRPLISLWGATHPSLGFLPWPQYSAQSQIISKGRSPISKHGKVQWWQRNPMKKFPVDEIALIAQKMLKDRTMP
jgi:ADP-heptose:LPS heptosyltransferase